MYHLNKIVWAVVNPAAVTILLVLAGLVLMAFQRGRKVACRSAFCLFLLAIVWLWFWSSWAVNGLLGGWLERKYVKYANPTDFARSGERYWIQDMADIPNADAIVLLGGGLSAQTNGYPYVEMSGGADRVWHTARLWHAGKSSLIVPTGAGERKVATPLLTALGVPDNAICIEGRARNTEENAKFTEELICEKFKNLTRPPKVLLVTSAFHMRRSELLFRKFAPRLEVVPCPTDFEVTERLMEPNRKFSLTELLPDPCAIGANAAAFKEIVGLLGYTFFR